MSPSANPNPAERRDRLAALLAACRDDPGLFHEAVLGRLPLHPKQAAIADSVVRRRVTVVPAAHAVGKSWYAATAALHWLYTRPGSKVVTTSASNNQLVSVLWAAIKAAHGRSAIRLAGTPSQGHGIPQRLDLAPEHFAIGFSAGKPESFSGFHGADILVIVDEASGVDQGVWDAIESLGYESLLALGNPIRATGHFRALYEQARAGAPGYAAHHLTAFDSPHAHLTDAEVRARGLPAGLTTRTWIDNVRRLYGEGSLYWKTRVLAEFPEVDCEQLIPTSWVDRCATVSRVRGTAPPAIACDIAKGTGRDRTVVVVADLLGVLDVTESDRIDVPSAAALVAQKRRQYGVRDEHMVYDAGGWAGSDMTRYLDQHGILGAVAYRGQGKGGRRFANARARAAWRLRQRLDPDRPLVTAPVPVDPAPMPTRRREPEPVVTIQPPFAIPPGPWWPALRRELLELRYRHDGKKIELEKKSEMAARLGGSPDLADTLLMLASLWEFDD